MNGTSHEQFVRDDKVEVGSEKSFGIVFAVVFFILGLWPLAFGGEARLWLLAIGGGFVLVAFLFPRLLRPLNHLWFRFGLFIARFMTPVVLGIVFLTAVVPTGVIMRLFGHDPLRLKLDPAAKSYWIVRDPPGPDPDSMKNQF